MSSSAAATLASGAAVQVVQRHAAVQVVSGRTATDNTMLEGIFWADVLWLPPT